LVLPRISSKDVWGDDVDCDSCCHDIYRCYVYHYGTFVDYDFVADYGSADDASANDGVDFDGVGCEYYDFDCCRCGADNYHRRRRRWPHYHLHYPSADYDDLDCDAVASMVTAIAIVVVYRCDDYFDRSYHDDHFGEDHGDRFVGGDYANRHPHHRDRCDGYFDYRIDDAAVAAAAGVVGCYGAVDDAHHDDSNDDYLDDAADSNYADSDSDEKDCADHRSMVDRQ